MSAPILRPASILISATLMAIAVEPLPPATALSGVQVGVTQSAAAHVTTGDVDGDGFVDLAVGGIMYWGSATGWNATSSTTLGGSSWLAIVPNLSGAGADNIIRSDVIQVDGNYGARLLHVELDAETRISTTSVLGLGQFDSDSYNSIPAVGDFAGDSKLDIAWIDNEGTLTRATNQGGSFASQSVAVGSGQYAAVAGIDWTGVGTGQLDLLLVHVVSSQELPEIYESQLFQHGSPLSAKQGFRKLIDAQAVNGIYLPQITVGDLNQVEGQVEGQGQGQDFIITTRSPSRYSYAAISTGSASNGPTYQKLNAQAAWIIPDVTGDGIDDIARSQGTAVGIMCGRKAIDLSALTIDRSIPVNGQGAPAYQFAFNPNESSNPMGLQPISVAIKATDSRWQQQLLMVDISKNGASASQLVPLLPPQLATTQLSVTASGSQPIVAPEAAVTFATTAGIITELLVSVSGAVSRDVLNDAMALPAGVTAANTLDDQGVLLRQYTGNLTPAQVTAVLLNVRLLPVPNAEVRTVVVAMKGRAAASDPQDFYASEPRVTATIIPPPVPLILTGPDESLINETITLRLTGGFAPYTVSASNGTIVVQGELLADEFGPYTPIILTPTALGDTDVVVVDSLNVIQAYTVTVSAPAINVAGPTTGVVGESTILRLSGGVPGFTVTATGATAVLGEMSSDEGGDYIPILVTPTAVGAIAVTVVDSLNTTSIYELTASAPALVISGPTTGVVGVPTILRLSGGVAGFTVTAPGATTAVGQVSTDEIGAYIPLTVTPTAVGAINVTVVDSVNTTTSYTIMASAPALIISGSTTGLVGVPTTLRLSGGVAGFTATATGATAVLGQATSDVNGVFVPLTVTPTAVGLVTVTVSDSLNSATTFSLTATQQPLVVTGVTTAVVGQTISLLVSNGTPAYTFSISGGVALAGSATANGTNVFVTPSQPGQMSFTVTDAAGVVVVYTVTAAVLPVASQPALEIPASVGGQTVFGAICAGSSVGVQSLRSSFARADVNRARGFTWDGPSQTYRELPAEPTAGLQPTDGVFLATRVDLGLEFSGPAMPPGTALILSAGWNFVGLGPVQLTAGSIVRTHALLEDFTLVDLSGAAVPTTDMSQAYLWNGSTYSTNTVLTSGVGYFIKNVSSPAKTILLRRKDADLDGRSAPVAGFARGVEAPPAPPTTQAADSSSGSACGTGSGIAAMLVGCLALLRIRIRR